jgi:HEAT repeat protein
MLDELRTRALLAIVSKGQPSKEVVEMLIESRDDPRVARQARYSLGVAARHLAQNDPQRSEAIVAMLIGDLQAAPSDDARRKALIALVGNTSLLLMQPCLPLLHSEDPGVRARAAEVLGYVASEEVAMALSALAQRDKAAEIRMEAVKGLGRQVANPRWLEIFVELARGDKAPLVRAAAVSALGSAGYRSEREAAQTLAWVAEHDPHANVRELAGENVEGPA